jgi:hypothetical protein
MSASWVEAAFTLPLYAPVDALAMMLTGAWGLHDDPTWASTPSGGVVLRVDSHCDSEPDLAPAAVTVAHVGGHGTATVTYDAGFVSSVEVDDAGVVRRVEQIVTLERTVYAGDRAWMPSTAPLPVDQVVSLGGDADLEAFVDAVTSSVHTTAPVEVMSADAWVEGDVVRVCATVCPTELHDTEKDARDDASDVVCDWLDAVGRAECVVVM